ncbi:MAG: AAA domain-containing protein [Patescibacteria group bacterium]
MKIIVINDLPSDVFSEHLLGKKSFSLTRLRFSEIISGGRVHPDLFLMVNQKIDQAAELKKLYHHVKVVSAFGGKEDFQPVVTFVYGKNDYDIFSYSNWNEFDELLLNNYARQSKKLNFKHDYYGDDSFVYEVNQELIKCRQSVVSSEFKNFLSESSSLSSKFISWMTSWAEGAKCLFFSVKNFARKKNISKINLTIKNEHNGLPLFNKGDNVNLFDDNQSVISLPEIKTIVSNSRDDKISISFSKTVIFYQLKKLKGIKLNSSLLIKKMNRMRLSLLSIVDGFMGSEEQLSAPASFICSALSGLPLERRTINYPREVILDNFSSKLLRDPSQVDAFLEMINDRPLSVIVGPAGTGKTYVSSVAIENFIRRGRKVLIVSHSNLGVDNLLFEVSKIVHRGRLFRFGNDESAVDIRNRHLLNRHPLEFNQYLDDDCGMVVACTIDSFLTMKIFNDGKFKSDVIFCDEASRGLYFEMTPLILAARQKLILIGDNHQLGNMPIPEVILNSLKEKTGLDDSRMKIFNKGLFSNLVESNYLPVVMLKQNRRSLPKISQLVSSTFYQNNLVAGRFNPYNEGELVFLDTKNFDLVGERLDGHSMFNPIEVNLLIKRFISYAIKHINSGGSIMNLAIIAPYQAQVNLLKKKLRKELLFNKYLARQVTPKNIDKILDHLIKTVDSIQGGERKIVFVSLVRSNDNQEIGFNKDICRLNVAMSRAQETLIIIGNSQPFLGCQHQDISQAFSQIVKYVKKHGSYVVLK